MDTTPIWFCLVQQTYTGGPMIYRIVESVVCTIEETSDLWEKYKDRCYGSDRIVPMYFHRDPTDSPLLEAARHVEAPQDQRNEVWPSEAEVEHDPSGYADW